MKRMKVFIIIAVLILLGITFILYLNFFNRDITGAATLNEYSYTIAICNETNYCQDYEIVCKNGEVVNKNPLTGAAIQHPQDWKDQRDKRLTDNLC